MSDLDEYHRFLARQGAATPVAPVPPTPLPKSRIPEPGTENNVRYVVRAGVTIAIPAADLLDDDFQLQLEVVEARPKSPAIRRPSARIPKESLKQGVVPEEPRIPPLPPAVPETDLEAAELWGRLPRQLQILGTMARLEPANGTRSFEETREELIHRLADPTLTLEETARLLDVCTATVRRYANRGHLSHHRTVGQQRRFRLSDVLQFLERRAERARTHG